MKKLTPKEEEFIKLQEENEYLRNMLINVLEEKFKQTYVPQLRVSFSK